MAALVEAVAGRPSRGLRPHDDGPHPRELWRRHWRGEISTGALPESATGDPGHHAVEVRDEVFRLLGRLGPRQRAVVVLRYYEGLSEAETASALGCSVGTVKSEASRALAHLRSVATAGKQDDAQRETRDPEGTRA